MFILFFYTLCCLFSISRLKDSSDVSFTYLVRSSCLLFKDFICMRCAIIIFFQLFWISVHYFLYPREKTTFGLDQDEKSKATLCNSSVTSISCLFVDFVSSVFSLKDKLLFIMHFEIFLVYL